MNSPSIRETRPRLDTPNAATYVGLGTSTLEKLRLTGGGPTFTKLGRRVVYHVDDLDSWAAAMKANSTSAPLYGVTRRAA